MDKPMSMSVKDFLIRTLAVKMLTSEKTIEAVVNHQFQSANEALDLNNSIEISGFGKFFFNNKKAIKRLAKLIQKSEAYQAIANNPETPQARKEYSLKVVEKDKDNIQQLKTKITYED